MSKKKYVLLLFFVAIVAGIAVTIMKDTYKIVPPIMLLAYRFFIGFLFIFIIKRKDIISRFDKKDILPIIVVAGFMTGGYVLYNLAAKYTTATNVSFLYSLSVLAIPFFAKWINKSDFNKKMFIGIIIALVGMYFLIVNGGTFSLNVGDILALLSAVVFALQVVFTGRYVGKVHPLVLVDLQLLVVSIVSFAISILIGESIHPETYGVKVWCEILYISIFSTGISYLIQTYAQTKVKESTVGIIYTFIPLFTVISAWIILGEKLVLSGILGGILIIIGIISASKLSTEN